MRFNCQLQLSQCRMKLLQRLTVQVERDIVYRVTGHFSLSCFTLTGYTMLISPFCASAYKLKASNHMYCIFFGPKHNRKIDKYVLLFTLPN